MEPKKKRGGAAGSTAPAEAPVEASATDRDAMPLEKALARLEAIVRELETGNIDLDRSLALFEEGVGLSRHASKRLSEAEAKITKLVRALDGEFRTEPFAEGAEAEE